MSRSNPTMHMSQEPKISDIKFTRTVLCHLSAHKRNVGLLYTMYQIWNTDYPSTAKKNYKNPAIYYLLATYLNPASFSLFTYLITCHPTAASYYVSISQLALLTSSQLPSKKHSSAFKIRTWPTTTIFDMEPHPVTACVTRQRPIAADCR